MKVVTVITVGGMEIVGRLMDGNIPTKTESGWVTQPTVDIKGRICSAITLEMPMQMHRAPIGAKAGPTIIPIPNSLCFTAPEPDSLVLFTSEILFVQETDPDFAETYVRSTSQVELGSAPATSNGAASSIVIARG